MAVMRHRGKWELQDRFASVWQYLPVSVPAGASGLRAELEYDRAAATLDLGCIGPAGFRGWSGGCLAGAAGLRAEFKSARPPATLALGCIGPPVFRGWSGGPRRSFAITAAQ